MMSAHRKERLSAFLLYAALGILYFSKAFIRRLLIIPEDSFLYSYPLRYYYGTHFLHHGIHLWLPYEFLGLPFLGTLQTGILYPPNWIYFFLPPPYAFNLSLIGHYIMAAFFTYLFAREIGIKRVPAFLSGIVFGFSGFLMAQQNHVPILDTAIWMPLLLYFYEKIRNTNDWKYAVFASFAVALQDCAGQFQMAVYTYLVLFLFAIFYFRSVERKRRLLFVALAVMPILLGALIALPQLVSTHQLSHYAWRVGEGYDLFVGYSLHPFALPLIVFPFFFGGGYGATDYWGPWNLPEMVGGFVGSLALAVALWTFFKKRKGDARVGFFGLVLLVGILLALGAYDPLYHMMYYIPVYNLFRVPARNLFEFVFAAAILFGIGIEHILYDDAIRDAAQVAGVIGILLLGGLAFCACGWLLAHYPEQRDVLTTVTLPPQINATFRLTNPALLVPAAFMAGYGLCLLGLHRFPANRRHVTLLLGVLLFAEAYSFGQFSQFAWSPVNVAQSFIRGPLLTFLKKNTTTERSLPVVPGPLPLYTVAGEVSTLNGYDPLILENFSYITGIGYYATPLKGWRRLLGNHALLDATHVKYFVVSRRKSSLEFFKQSTANPQGSDKTPYREVFKTSTAAVFENPDCMPKAFAVTRLVPVNTLEQATHRWFDMSFRPDREGMVSGGALAAIGQSVFSPGTVEVRAYDTDRVTLDASFQGKGFVVLSDQYYPGWKAFVDGHEMSIWQVDGLFRGVVVPAGHHAVVFRFLPSSTIGAAIVAAAVLVLCITSLLFRAFQ